MATQVIAPSSMLFLHPTAPKHNNNPGATVRDIHSTICRELNNEAPRGRHANTLNMPGYPPHMMTSHRAEQHLVCIKPLRLELRCVIRTREQRHAFWRWYFEVTSVLVAVSIGHARVCIRLRASEEKPGKQPWQPVDSGSSFYFIFSTIYKKGGLETRRSTLRRTPTDQVISINNYTHLHEER